MSSVDESPTAQEITFDEWRRTEAQRLVAFKDFWGTGAMGGDPHAPAEAFPKRMSAGEWDEQYRCWEDA